MKQPNRTTCPRIEHPLLRRSTLTAAILAPVMAFGSLPAEAQAPTGERQPRATMLEEVVVTARRRQESLQDVPIAITALTDEFMRSNSIENFDQIRHHAPALTISSAGTGANTPVISLRGQRAAESALHLEGAVPMYMADVVLTPAAGTNMIMYDLESVQVLKGPQGTLFGRNSTGGALLFTPKRPGEEFGGYAQLTAGNYDRVGTEFGIDVPVSDKLMFRIAGKTEDRDGYQKNILNGEELWDEKSRALRLSVLARPNEKLENLLIVAWDKNDTKGLQPRLEAHASHLADQFGDDLERSLARDPMRIESDQPGQYEDVENWFVANTTEYRLGNTTLKNIFGYRKVDLSSVYDGDGSAENFANMALDGRPAYTEAEMYSNEFQVLGTALEDRLDWIVGAYYWQLKGERFSRSHVNMMAQVAPGTFMPITFDNIQGGEVDNAAWAVFAQSSYKVTDRLGVTAGVRWSWDRRELDLQNNRFWYDNPNPTVRGRMCTVQGDDGNLLSPDNCSKPLKDDWNSPTWLLSADYELTPGTMVYGSVSTGYRTGGFGIRATTLDEQRPFDEEKVINYELGLKADWDYRDWSFRTNAAVYHQSFDDIQRTVSLPASDGSNAFVTMTVNAAEATIKGAELELHASAPFGLDLSLNYAYVDAEYDQFTDQHGVDQSGHSMEWVPKTQLTATARYTLPLNPSLGDMSLQANYYHQSRQPTTVYTGYDPIEDRIKYVGSYSVLNYNLDWRSVMGSNFDVSFYVKNAQDKRYGVGGLVVVDSLGVALLNYGEPRTYGASLRYNF